MAEFIAPKGLLNRDFYAHVVKVGNTIYIAGQLSRDENETIVGIGDFKAQAVQVFKNIEIALASAGATFADVVFTRSYFLDICQENKNALADVHRMYFEPGKGPPSTWVEVTGLVAKDYLLETEVVAVIE